MKKRPLALTLTLAATLGIVVAQTVTAPQPIDWRYKHYWSDPNAPGAVTSWTIYASNTAWMRSVSVPAPSLTVTYNTLLNGAPAGTYAIFATAASNLADTSEASTNHYVVWPGGNGHIKPGLGLGSGR